MTERNCDMDRKEKIRNKIRENKDKKSNESRFVMNAQEVRVNKKK